MKPTSWIGSLIVSLSFGYTATPAIALSPEDVPNPRQINGGWVTDMAKVLTPQTEAELNRQITSLEAKNGSEISDQRVIGEINAADFAEGVAKANDQI